MKRWLIPILCLMAVAAIGATTFSGNTLVRLAWAHQKTGTTTTAEDFSGDANRLFDWDHTSGTASNQMNTLFRETVTLTNGQARTVNLATGVANAFGDTVTFDEVRFLAVTTLAANLNNITVGNAATNEFDSWCGGTNQTITVVPGGTWIMVAPNTAGYDSSTDGNLKILNSGTNSVTYDLWVGGAN